MTAITSGAMYRQWWWWWWWWWWWFGDGDRMIGFEGGREGRIESKGD